MILDQYYLDCLSQASYLVGDKTSGRAVVVDPRRDVSAYVAAAEEHGVRIELVIETHFHADFLSGHLELAAATGATIAYGSAAETEFDSRKLADGEVIDLGRVALEIRHTPGHTPESISIVVHDGGIDEPPHAVLTGDTLFVGDVGRPDLLSSKGVTSEELAADLYRSLHDRLLTLPDETRVYPAHGAGSACGKNLSSDTWSTIGEQRRTNYALAPMSEDDFVGLVTSGHTAPPAYFAFDAMLNRELRPLLDEEAAPPPLSLDEVLERQADGAIVLDAREPDPFAAAHIAGSINVGLGGRYAEFVGGVLRADVPIVLVVEPASVVEAKNRLARIGFDNVVAHLDDPERALVGGADSIVTGDRVDVDAMADAMASVPDLQLVDVRQPGETEGGIVPGAVLVPLTLLNEQLASLAPDRPTIVYCAGGFRSSIAASCLVRAGFTRVSDLVGGYGAWEASGRETTEADQPVG